MLSPESRSSPILQHKNPSPEKHTASRPHTSPLTLPGTNSPLSPPQGLEACYCGETECVNCRGCWMYVCVRICALAMTTALWGTAKKKAVPAFPWCSKNVNYTDSDGSLHMTSNRRRQSRWNWLILPFLFSFSLKRDFKRESIIFCLKCSGFSQIFNQLDFFKVGGTATWKKINTSN